MLNGFLSIKSTYLAHLLIRLHFGGWPPSKLPLIKSEAKGEKYFIQEREEVDKLQKCDFDRWSRKNNSQIVKIVKVLRKPKSLKIGSLGNYTFLSRMALTCHYSYIA